MMNCDELDMAIIADLMNHSNHSTNNIFFVENPHKTFHSKQRLETAEAIDCKHHGSMPNSLNLAASLSTSCCAAIASRSALSAL
jgi:hypothetical protein